MNIKSFLLTSLGLLPLAATAIASSTPPQQNQDLTVCATYEDLSAAAALDNGNTRLYNESGVYYVKNVDTGRPLAVVADSLVPMIEQRMADAEAWMANEGMEERDMEVGVSEWSDGGLVRRQGGCRPTQCNRTQECYIGCWICSVRLVCA
ncbi:hypothetical protein BJY04DRAFT_218521 [Aspergillus karnatakaensis]|uniref:uncharacterized protein n=1 Tax=Aspergillus karnatakaensis TaxID=1810916 RepID=UPI003CCC9DD1